MTIFRCSVAFVMASAAACSSGSSGSGTELGKIVNDQDYTLAAADLQRFAEERLRNRDSLRQEFEAAGFTRSIYTDGPDSMECERFARTVRHNPPAEYAVDICGQHVFANAGVLNP